MSHRLITSAILATLVAVTALVGGAAPLPAGADGNDAPGAPLAFRSLSLGEGHSCAILPNAQVKCWGEGGGGRLGSGDGARRGDQPGEMGDHLPYVDLGTSSPGVPHRVTALAAGEFHTCALLATGQVKCWGIGGNGALGYGDNAARGDSPIEMGNALPVVDLGPGRTATAIAGGQTHTCARLDTGQVKCWGNGGAGRLGYGDTITRGDGVGEMGSALPVVDLGAGRTATAIAAGFEHTCALLDNATVKCWGEGSQGRLGQGAVTDVGDAPGEMGAALAPVLLGSGRTAVAISAGGFHTCALLDDGSVKCWGSNSFGQLGLGDTAARGDAPTEMGDILPPVELGTGRTAIGVVTGNGHTCAVLDGGDLKCWGGGAAGQLGYGDVDNRGDALGEMDEDLPLVNLGAARRVVGLASGRAHVCALLDDGTVRCWGGNPDGRLGLGDTVQRGDGPGEMGAALPVVELGIVRAEVAVNLTRDQVEVVAGQEIDYDVTVTNIGGRPLTDVDVLAPDVPDCTASTATLDLGASFSYPCTYTTTADDAPMMTNQVLVTTEQSVYALSGTRRTRVLVNTFQPDGRIRLGAGAPVGNDVHNTSASGQSRSANVGNLGTATFTATIQNDGNTATAVRLQGAGTTNRFTVTYRNGATDVTAAVVAGTFQTASLAPGATQDLTVIIKAKAGTPLGTSLSRLVTATSVSNPTTKDAVRAVVTRR